MLFLNGRGKLKLLTIKLMTNYLQYNLLVVFTICFFFNSQAATFYVSTSGSNSNSGTINSPWLTIQHGVNQMTYGDYLIIRPGTYQEGVWLGFNGYNDNPSDYIYIIGNGNVILEGNNTEYSAFNTYHSSWVHIENVTVQNYIGHGINFDGKTNLNTYGTPLEHIRIKNVKGYDNGNSSWKYGIFLRDVENFIIDGCTIVDSEWSNITIEECIYGGITNCYVSHEGKKYYKNDADGILVQNSQYIRIANCIANYSHEDGIDIGGHSGGDIAHISVHNCISMNGNSNGFPFSVTNDNSFDGYDISFTKCLSYNNAESGIVLYQHPDDVRIAHVTCTDNAYGVNIQPENPQNINMRNNIFAGNSNDNFSTNSISTSVFSLSHTNWGTNPPSSAYQGASPQIQNPDFVNPGANNYTLDIGSPCINAGSDLTFTTSAGAGTIVQVDYSKYFNDGFGIVQGDSIDIGGQEALIVSVPNATTIVIADPIAWNNNTPVNFIFNGMAPDLGYRETANFNPNCSDITIWAAGDSNQEEMALFIDGQEVASWNNIGGDFNNQVYQTYTFNHCGPVSFDCIMVALVDASVVNGLDNNLRVDKIAINGTVKETESPDVYGEGVYINNCTNGYHQTEKLFCGGTAFFVYGSADSDQDGVCNSADICPNFDDKLIGTSCDDNNPNTLNDVYTTDCSCEGSCSIGQACDDNDPCTVNDQIIDNSCNCKGIFQNGGGNPSCSFLEIDIQVCLEGAYDLNTGKMRTNLWQSNLLPNLQPYGSPPWNYQGTEGQGWTKADYPVNTVDWVLVSFRTGISKNTEIKQVAALILEDGSLHFPQDRILDGNLATAFYVMIQHRNHIGALSAQAITPANGRLSLNFCSTDSYTNGFGQKELAAGLWGLFAGDGNQVNDVGFDINGQDYASWVQFNGQFNKYSLWDFNLDSDISALDRILWSGNNGIYSQLDK